MNFPTQEMIDAGNEVLVEMVLSSVKKNGLPGVCKKNKVKSSPTKYKKIVKAYINNKIDSVTAIWLAMNEVEPKEKK